MRKKLPEDSNFFLSPTPSREMIMLLARGRARQELREKQKQRELQNINRPPPPANRPPDVFEQAAARYYGHQEAVDAILRELDENLSAIDREFQKRRAFRRSIERARKILADTAYLSRKK
jgi:hypothetical protein